MRFRIGTLTQNGSLSPLHLCRNGRPFHNADTRLKVTVLRGASQSPVRLAGMFRTMGFGEILAPRWHSGSPAPNENRFDWSENA